MATFRTYLRLGRVSNLPTVWSNCLAGWLLGGAGEWRSLALLGAGATGLYLAGAHLNDAFDAPWDRQRRPERPVPSGAISVAEVWQWGLLWMALGLAALVFLGPTSTVLALLLAVSIFVYDALHKMFAFSPLLMAACRWLLLLLAASAGVHGISGLAVWSALALGSYILGLSLLARYESTRKPAPFWPSGFLAAPALLALVVNRGEWLLRGTLLTGGLLLWTLWCLRFAYWSEHRHVARCVAGLLAGIPLVDLLAVCGHPASAGWALVGLFLASLLLQRLVPAT